MIGPLIGILGQASSGKDTMAAYMSEKYKFNRVSLADPLKRYAKEVFDFSDEQLWGESQLRNVEDPRWKVSPRVALQTLGTEWGRSLHGDVWIQYGLKVARKIMSNTHTYDPKTGLVERSFISKYFHEYYCEAPGVVIPDIRFKNEIWAVQDAGGYIIQIKREGKDGDVGIANHPSETEQKSVSPSEVDYVLDVPEGHALFRHAIDRAMEDVLQHKVRRKRVR